MFKTSTELDSFYPVVRPLILLSNMNLTFFFTYLLTFTIDEFFDFKARLIVPQYWIVLKKRVF